MKYGTKHPKQSDGVKTKCKELLQLKYGVDNVSQLPDHTKKTQETCLAKYGAISYAGSEIGRKATRSTNLARYGCEEPLGNPVIREKLNQLNLAKYDTIHPSTLKQFRDKAKQTWLQRYGVSNPMQCEAIKIKFHSRYAASHGVDWPSQNPEVKAKLSATCMERYNVRWACMRPEARSKGSRSQLNIAFETLLNTAGLPVESEFVIENKSYDIKTNFTLIEIDPTITHNSYMSIFPNTSSRPSDYHIQKSRLAEKYGYRCIHVFDWDDWDKMLQLVTEPDHLIYARNKKVSLRECDEDTAIEFTSAYHIQGSCRGQQVNYGLYYDNELIQLMTFGSPRYNKKYDWELLRLCTKHGWRLVGGASKLFKHFIQNHLHQSIISYCDLAKFSGTVYTAIGMQLAYSTEPAKIWSKDKKYVTDNLLRQRGYDQLFGTNYGKGTSNEELMIQNGWLPVYDCGQRVFEYVPE